MKAGQNVLQKGRYYSGVILLYAVTLLFAWQLFNPFTPNKGSTPVSAQSVVSIPEKKPETVRYAITGKPIRIHIKDPSNGLEINLPVDEGFYDEKTQTWTISGWKAQFAMPSLLANDVQGNTLIYGHNNKDAFGYLARMKPGAEAIITADNGRVFKYVYELEQVLQPDDVTVFKYDGPPTLVVQTCSGNWNELRSLYFFKFVSVT